MTMSFPNDAAFAFTILDDTDDATTANIKPVYDLLRELGMRTTKTAWPLDCAQGSALYFAADTLQDGGYLEFVRGLVRDGFEFGFHGAAMESSPRERTEAGLRFIADQLGLAPAIHCNHGQNLENVYWGFDRYRSWPLRLLFGLLGGHGGFTRYQGHRPESDYFWGDICRERFKFVRNFTFRHLDVSAIAPGRPYRLRSTPYVNYWFTTTDVPDVSHFNTLVTPARLDQLARQGGYSIISTHLGKGFVRDGVLDRRFEATLRHLATLPGWFVPVGQLLEYLIAGDAQCELSSLALFRLELCHVVDRMVALGQRLARRGVEEP